jgi:hypothetical protein
MISERHSWVMSERCPFWRAALRRALSTSQLTAGDNRDIPAHCDDSPYRTTRRVNFAATVFPSSRSCDVEPGFVMWGSLQCGGDISDLRMRTKMQ